MTLAFSESYDNVLAYDTKYLGLFPNSMRMYSSGACSGSEKLRTNHHVSSETAECEERACSNLQENKPAPTNESD